MGSLMPNGQNRSPLPLPDHEYVPMNRPHCETKRQTAEPAGRIGPPVKILTVVLALLVVACATKRPVLYPNAHLHTVGQITAQHDIDQCVQLARDYGTETDQNEIIAKNTAGAAAVGGASGAAAGAVLGSPGRGAGAGAAGGAAAAMTRSIIDSGEPQPVFRAFVEKCLRDKGYVPIGWK